MRIKVSSVVLAGLFAAGCSSSPPAASQAGEAPVTVSIGQASRSDVAVRHEAGGIVRSRTTAVIASRVMAAVSQVAVRPGDRVRQGAPLVLLDRRDRQADAARLAAAVVAAREAVQAAEADGRAAESAATLTRLTYDRMAALHERRSATTQELDRATAERQAADAQLESVHARLRGARASLEAATAAAAMADVSLSDTTLTAPFDGVITERRVDPGTLAVPGAPLLVLDGGGGARLEADVDEARAAYLTVGQRVDVKLDARADVWHPATVVEIARVDPTSHAFLVKADLPAGTDAPSGAFGRLRFAGARRGSLVVPARAVVRRAQLAFVFAVRPDGRARLTAVTPGTTVDDATEVLAGVDAGTRVVLSPPPALRDGMRVVAAGDRP